MTATLVLWLFGTGWLPALLAVVWADPPAHPQPRKELIMSTIVRAAQINLDGVPTLRLRGQWGYVLGYARTACEIPALLEAARIDLADIEIKED